MSKQRRWPRRVAGVAALASATVPAAVLVAAHGVTDLPPARPESGARLVTRTAPLFATAAVTVGGIAWPWASVAAAAASITGSAGASCWLWLGRRAGSRN